MNLILLFADDFLPDGARVRLTGRRLQHVREVHRAAKGDRLCVGLLGGDIGSGLVEQLDDTALVMRIAWERQPPPPLPLTLLLALPRPKVLRRVLAGAASMGVKRIVLLNAYRVEKSYWQSPFLQPEKIREQLILGLEQGRDTILPEVLLKKRFKPFVEDELPQLSADCQALVAHPGSPQQCPRQVTGPVTLAIGPEGGLIPYEVEKLQECGFTAVHCGERILRVETALPALLGRLF